MTDPAIDRYFAVLGLPSTASEEEVKEARNFVTKAFHPDKYQAGSKDQLKAHQRQVEINEAYDRLIEWFAAQRQIEARRARAGSGSQAAHANEQSKDKLVSVVKIVFICALTAGWLFLINDWYSLPSGGGLQSSSAEITSRSDDGNQAATALASAQPASSASPVASAPTDAPGSSAATDRKAKGPTIGHAFSGVNTVYISCGLAFVRSRGKKSN